MSLVKISLFWFSMVILMIFDCYARPQCHPEDNSALFQLRPSIDTTMQEWNISTDCCTWEGVMCNKATGHVVSLQIFTQTEIASNSTLFSLRNLKSLSINLFMISNGISLGTIPQSSFKELARNLTRLEELHIFSIDMSSISLALLANLSSSLTSLTIFDCILDGELADDVFRSFSKLESLVLPENYIRGRLPQSLFSLENLQTLKLNDNEFSSHVPEICNESIPQSMSSSCVFGKIPSNLTTLYLSNNFLDGPLPSWIYSLPNIDSLELSNNNFSGGISDFHTPSLTTLLLDQNKLHGLIGVFHTPSLIQLSLNHNRLYGSVPISLFQNVALQQLDLSSNSLIGKVEIKDIVKLKELIDLDFSFNNLSISGSHKSIGSNVKFLSLSSCQISEFPLFLKSLKTLESLDLSFNQLQGSVPSWFLETSKSSLTYLNLSHNSFTYIHSLSWNNLQVLDLRSNSFCGHLQALTTNLEIFLASQNNFSGEIPKSICNFTSLQVLDFSYNNLSGNFPECLGSSSERLSVIDLRMNKLHGTISSTKFPKENQLRSLNLNGNQLEGDVPRSLVNCSLLEVLDLGNNAFDDTFPNWLESLPNLEVLVLRANKFHGSIGNYTHNKLPFSKLRIMDLSQNEFTSALPIKYFDNFEAMKKIETEEEKISYMGNFVVGVYYQDSVKVTMKGYDSELAKILTIFTTIDFSRNNFTGAIPKSLGKLKSLKGLNLSHNMLTHTLPSSLGSLSNLEWLDLSSNQIVGKIPHELADITSLGNLKLSHNRLEGPIPQGKQFNTFGNESFEGNLDLCGFPLSKKCGGVNNKPSLPDLEKEDDRGSNEFDTWKIVMMGFASGLVIGLSIGYVLLYSNGKLSWLSEKILVELAMMNAKLQRSRNSRRLKSIM